MQVKNYDQRQVDSGKMSEWEELAREADEKRERGESTSPLPSPTIIPQRRYNGPSPVNSSSASRDPIIFIDESVNLSAFVL